MIAKFFSWDKPRNVESNLKGVKKGDKVVVSQEWGVFLAEVLLPDKVLDQEPLNGQVLRIATTEDLEEAEEAEMLGRELLAETKKRVKFFGLEMKVIDASVSLDGSSAVISFVADGRVDFRQLVREISSKFSKSVRLQQIGSRDEARQLGGCGICGMEVCCRKFSGCIKSISTDMARCQLISHRGSDRISGLCGRLMCCLSYEADQYEDMMSELPSKGDIVEVGEKTGKVVDVMVLAGKVKVSFGRDDQVLVEKDKIKKLKK